MADILFIKTSSLGDVIHHMPALVEARRRLPDARFAWVVEEAFAPLVRLHPAVDEVIPVASRRWRHALLSAATWREVRAFRRLVRSRAYDAVIDTQGLLRTAVIARLARGRRHGYDSASIREPLAARFYDVRHRVSRDLHAIDRNRILTGLALGYSPEGAIDFGLDRAALADAAGGALCDPAACDRAGDQAVAGGALDRARPRARGARARSCSCHGAPRPSGSAASASPPACRARVSPIAARSTSSRAASPARSSSSASTPGCCIWRRRSACRWSASSSAASRD